jgi:hypothetical protein
LWACFVSIAKRLAGGRAGGRFEIQGSLIARFEIVPTEAIQA